MSKYLCLALALLVGCKQDTPPSGTKRLQVLATTGMVADLVDKVGGELVHVTTLFGPGVDPHTYSPSPKDVRKLYTVDVVFYSGLHLEGKMTEALENPNLKSVSVGDRLPKDKLLQEEEGVSDPHVWFDVSLWAEGALVVAEGLAHHDPAHAEEYRQRGQAYRKVLLDLHQEAKTNLQSIPEKSRVLITSHDAFSYFGRAYGIEVHGILGITTDAEASIANINKLVNLIVERNIKAVFVESSVNDRTMKSLLEGCKAKGHAVTVGGTLFSDAMGEPGTDAGTYVGMVRHNVKTLVEKLK